jgi:hypothetical protein
MTVTLASIGVAIINIKSNNNLSSGDSALMDANSGVENALLQLERNPSYSGETLTIGSGSATISVSGSSPITIVSIGSVGDFKRTVTATASINANVLTLDSWSETP